MSDGHVPPTKPPVTRQSQASIQSSHSRPASKSGKYSRQSTIGGPASGSISRGHGSKVLPRPSNSHGSRISMAHGSRMTNRTDPGSTTDYRVVDDEGRDRTPKPLCGSRPSFPRGLMPSIARETSSMLRAPSVMGDSARGSWDHSSELSYGNFDRMSSMGSQVGRPFSMTGGMTPDMYDDDPSPRQSDTGHRRRGPMQAEAPVGGPGPAAAAGDEVGSGSTRQNVPLTNAELDADVPLNLQESSIMWHFGLPGCSVNSETEAGQIAGESNRRYQRMLKAHENTEALTEASVQTLNLMLKSKETQCPSMLSKTTEAQVWRWDIQDTMRVEREVEQDGMPGEGARNPGPHPEPEEAEEALPAEVGPDWDDAGDAGDGASAYGSTTSKRESISGSLAGAQSAGQEDMASVAGSLRSSVSHSSVAPSIMSAAPQGTTVQGGEAASVEAGHGAGPPVDCLAKLQGLKQALELADLALAQRCYLRQQLLYRNIPIIPQVPQTTGAMGGEWGEGAEEGALLPQHLPQQLPQQIPQQLPQQGRSKPILELLWQWKCNLTHGLTATCLAWNKVRKDVLAVGYGSTQFGPNEAGRIALWSLKNPGQPMWTCATAAGVTALDFSLHNGNVVAVGLYNGSLLLYDVKARQEAVMMGSRSGAGGHGEPIWQLRWVDCGPERGEALTTISTDGRITRWSITQGLEPSDLMRLRRAANKKGVVGPGASGAAQLHAAPAGHVGVGAGPGSGAGAGASRSSKTEALISRHSGGFCFDFAGQDGRIYLAGTEDGQVHKCSVAYSEQYLATHVGHMGPVYRVQWSPFCPHIFLSASADWTLNIWADGKEAPLLTLTMGNDEVTDACWCPSASTLLAATTSGGALQLWDLATSTLRPACSVTLPPPEEEGTPVGHMACLAFSPAASVLAAGDTRGGVSLYRLWGSLDGEGCDMDASAQAAALKAALQASGAKVSASAQAA